MTLQRRALSAFLLAILALGCLGGLAHAQSSLGIGTNEAVLPSTGLFGGFFNAVNQWQQGFYRQLTGALKTMRDGGGGVWLLVGLSFLYGIFHAAGPGHGKAVISSYMLANEVTLRRGIVLSFISAFLQAATAIAVMTLVFLFLRGTAVSMTDATWVLEVASYALITGFGAWLLWKKARRFLSASRLPRPALSLGAAAVSPASSLFDEAVPAHAFRASPVPSRSFRALAAEGVRAEDDICIDCGRSHVPDPALLAGDRFNWRTAWTAVVAVGLRPCTGALIVLSFAFLHGLWLGGIISVLAMALGTALTVSVLAVIAVTAKGWAIAIAGQDSRSGRIHALIEIGGAALVFLFGSILLAASLSA